MAKTDYQLVIESVKGEMKRDGKEEGIEVFEFRFEADIPRDAATGQARARRRYSDITFVKLLDRSSPIIMQMLSTHSKIKKATLTLHKAGDIDKDGTPLKYYTLVVSDAYISSYKIHGDGSLVDIATIPRDEFTINYRKIEIEYKPQNAKGMAEGSTMFADEWNDAFSS
jgi:type VI secretion system secreted protein Hcp